MNSLIHLSQSPVRVAPEGLSSARRVYVSLGHGSLISVSQSCKRSHLVSRPLYVKGTLDRISEGPKIKENGKKKKNNNVMRGVGRASLVMACVLGAFTLSGKMSPKPNIAYAVSEKSFFKAENPDPSDVEALKLWTTALLKKDVAEEIIRGECKRFKGTALSNPLQVALIEVLLDGKKYGEASEEIDDLLTKGKCKQVKGEIGKLLAEANYKEAKEKIDQLFAEGKYQEVKEEIDKLPSKGKYKEEKQKIGQLLDEIDSMDNSGLADFPKEKIYLLKAIAESKSRPTEAQKWWERYLDELWSSPSTVDRNN